MKTRAAGIALGLLISMNAFAASYDGIYERPDGNRLFLKADGSLPSDRTAVDIVPKGKPQNWSEGDHFKVTFNGNISVEDTVRSNQCDVTLTLLSGAVAVNDKCGGSSSGIYQKMTSNTEDAAWNDSNCGFKKVGIMGTPDQLVKEFIEKDSQGEFLTSSPWMLQIVLCPAHLRGPDAVTVISGYKINDFQVKPDTAEVNVTFDVLGTVTSGGPAGDMNAFDSDKKQENITFKLTKTPYGWRFNQFAWLHVRGSALAARPPHQNWVSGDYQKFLKATGLPAAAPTTPTAAK